MVTRHRSTSTHDMLLAIDDMDFTMVKLKLMDAEESEGWSADYSDRVEVEYRRYLGLTRQYPEKAIVPSKIVDKFWHAHILDTQAYSEDCARAFGYFLHHYPYFGMQGEQDAKELVNAYDETLALYEAHYGHAPDDLWDHEGAARCPNCGRKRR